MKAQGGAILVTGNTSSERGRARFAGFAPTKAAQRILTESIARELWPLGIHVAYFVIDAVIDVPWTRERFAGKPDDFFIQPADIADAAFHVAHQPKRAWSFRTEIRPFGADWRWGPTCQGDRKRVVEGTRVSVRGDIGGWGR